MVKCIKKFIPLALFLNPLPQNMTICRSMMSDAIGNSKKCQKLTTSASDQCNCWANQTVLMNKIKQFDCAAKKTQKLITDQKVKW